MNFKKVFVFSLLISFVLISCNNKSSKKKLITLNPDTLQSGDIILKRGKGVVSNIIVQLLKEKIPISHCGIISCSKDSTYIIHSIASELSEKDGLQTILLSDFLKDYQENTLFVIRHKSDINNRLQIEQNAQNYLANKIPFDYKFDILNKDEIYCSELVYHVLMDTYGQFFFKKEIIQNNELLMFNSLINDTVNFEHIYSGI